jgi:hypothetical protein
MSPGLAQQLASRWRKPGCCSWSAAMFTLTGTSSPWACQAAICASAVAITQSPTSRLMGWFLHGLQEGGRRQQAALGCCQRISASAPTTAPVRMLTLGW